MDRALRTIRSLSDGSARSQGTMQVADRLVDAGRMEEAERLVAECCDSYNKRFALCSIAAGYAARGQLDEALATAGRIDEARQRLSALVKIAEHASKQGAEARAEDLLESVMRGSAELDGIFLTWLAVDLLERGQPARALRLMEGRDLSELEHNEWLSALLKHAPRDVAVEWVVQAAEDPRKALACCPALAQMDPSQARDIMQALQALDGTGGLD